MQRTLLLSSLALLGTLLVVPEVPVQSQGTPVNLILDTDIGPDYDDVGAMAVMHTLADSGQVNILATVASNQSKYIAATLNVLNTYFGRPNIPVGVVRGRGVNLTAGQKWDSLLVVRYPHKIKNNEEAEDALTLYRRTLAAEPDGSVTIVTVGFLTNMADLLISKPDKYSPLNGRDLIMKKVKKLVSMAGRFPEGREFNVDRDPVSSKIVFDGWPTPILLSGFEIGQAVHTGLPLTQNSKIQHSPVKDVFSRSIPMSKQDEKGRMSWDQTAVLVAIKRPETYYSLMEGRFVAKDDGSNGWNPAGKGHYRLVEKMPVPQVERVLEALMAR
ncbi:nucleoside hydrolase [Salmonirosea aquatica]|uniref:Nucleoside hydrolase n=1 Tax=Salmonirosea aquatica TaxID=2654236 RepID=A0A7C9FQ20_9BACT|nr:nucleoside hydrolase [Cytophagaceae bacterium SJW1-29]